MKEPTREQIKEAFKETIERWEKIVEDVSYFAETRCELCYLPSPGCTRCPVFERDVGNHNCKRTPFWTFENERSPANALAELNFLRKVYIWWMEKSVGKSAIQGEGLLGNKKEEWVDVTEKIKWRAGTSVEDFNILWGDYEERTIVYLGQSGLKTNRKDDESIKLETLEGDWVLSGHAFRILKKI